jgi:hypothetical protein
MVEGKLELADDACKKPNFHHLFPYEPRIHFVNNPQVNRYVRRGDWLISLDDTGQFYFDEMTLIGALAEASGDLVFKQRKISAVKLLMSFPLAASKATIPIRNRPLRV